MFDQPLRELNAEIENINNRFQTLLPSGFNFTRFPSPSINDAFGGSPRDRNYIFTAENSITSLAFHGCPVVVNDRMLVFGAGPDMKDYLEKMYKDYDHYYENESEMEQAKKDAKRRKCERKLGDQIEAYFRANKVSGTVLKKFYNFNWYTL